MINFFLNARSSCILILLFCVNISHGATEISPIIGFGNDIFVFNIEELGQKTTPLEFEPNPPGLTRIGANAYGFGASISLRNDVKTIDTNKGFTRFLDFQLAYNNLKWGADLFVQDYTGFYLKNTSTHFQGVPPYSPYYILYPNLKWIHYGLMGRYAMDNQGFLVSALTTQSEQIKKSAGSYFVTGGYRYHSLDSDISLIPADLQGINAEMDNLRKLKANSINLGLGAGKYWVNNSHFFIGGLFDLLGTYAIYSYERTTGESQSSYGTLSYNYKIGLGYSGESFRSGLSISGEVTTLKGLNYAFLKPNATQLLLYFRVAF